MKDQINKDNDNKEKQIAENEKQKEQLSKNEAKKNVEIIKGVDPYRDKAMKALGLNHKSWNYLTDSEKYNVSNEAYKIEERAAKRAAKKKNK